MHDSGILSPKAVGRGFRPHELRFLPHIQGLTDTGIRRIHGYRIRYPSTDTDTDTKKFKNGYGYGCKKFEKRIRIRIQKNKF